VWVALLHHRPQVQFCALSAVASLIVGHLALLICLECEEKCSNFMHLSFSNWSFFRATSFTDVIIFTEQMACRWTFLLLVPYQMFDFFLCSVTVDSDS